MFWFCSNFVQKGIFNTESKALTLLITFIATNFESDFCFALYTLPKEPSPRKLTTSYLSIVAVLLSYSEYLSKYVTTIYFHILVCKYIYIVSSSFVI